MCAIAAPYTSTPSSNLDLPTLAIGKLDLTRVEVARVPTPLVDHISPLSVDVPTFRVTVKTIPLVIRIRNVELPQRQDEHDFDLHHSKLLSDAISGPSFEWTPRVLRRVQGITFSHKPTFRQEFFRARPVAGIVVDAVMIAPDEAVFRRKLTPVRSGQEKVWLSSA